MVGSLLKNFTYTYDRQKKKNKKFFFSGCTQPTILKGFKKDSDKSQQG